MVQLIPKRTSTESTYALAADGTVWRLEERGTDQGSHFAVSDRQWVRAENFPPLPGGES